MSSHPMSVNVNTRIRWHAIKDMSWVHDISGKRVADVGCGLGFFTEKFQERGASVVGIDIDRPALDYVVKNYGVETHFMDIESDHLPGEPYDIVFIGEVMEHVTNPGKVYRHVMQSLKPDGLLILTTPALEGWLTLSKGKQLAHDHGGQKHAREGFYRDELDDLARESGMTTLTHHFCLYSLAELFMQLTKVGYLVSKKNYDGQSDVLDMTRGYSYKILRVVFPVMWLGFIAEAAVMGLFRARGHCHVQVAAPIAVNVADKD